MTSHITYEGVVPSAQGDSSRGNDDQSPDHHGLFAGQRLWFSHLVPQRKWLMQNAEAHGAIVVKMDTDADIRLVDHVRKNNAPGTHSYRYVELSIQKGTLEDLSHHAVGIAARVNRPVGSITTAASGRRAKFTDHEDQLLWNWIKPFEEAGGQSKGNEIYKQLERINPRHTYQSWRDRWLKYTRYQKRQVTETVEEIQGTDRTLSPEQSPARPLASRKRQRDERDERDDNGQEPSQRPRPGPPAAAPQSVTVATDTGAVGEHVPTSLQNNEPDVHKPNPRSPPQAQPASTAASSSIQRVVQTSHTVPSEKEQVRAKSPSFEPEHHSPGRPPGQDEARTKRVGEKARSSSQLATQETQSQTEQSTVGESTVEGSQNQQTLRPLLDSADPSLTENPLHLRERLAPQQPSVERARCASPDRPIRRFQQTPADWTSRRVLRDEPGALGLRPPSSSTAEDATQTTSHATNSSGEVFSPTPDQSLQVLPKFANRKADDSPFASLSTQFVPETTQTDRKTASFDQDEEEESDEEELLPSTPRKGRKVPDAVDDLQTSPLNVNLFSEQDLQVQNPASDADLLSEPASDQTDFGHPNILEHREFKTPPDSMADYETAPEHVPSPSQDSQLDSRSDPDTPRLSTAVPNPAADLDLTLAEPEGGWAAYGIYSRSPSPAQGKDEPAAHAGPETSGEPDAEEVLLEEVPETDDSDAKGPLPIDEWLDAHIAKYQDKLDNYEPVLNAAVYACSFDLALADQVVERVVREIQAQGDTGRGNKTDVAGRRWTLPTDLAGCWSATDDADLLSTDARAVERVIRNHGRDKCDERFVFLEEWAEH